MARHFFTHGDHFLHCVRQLMIVQVSLDGRVCNWDAGHFYQKLKENNNKKGKERKKKEESKKKNVTR